VADCAVKICFFAQSLGQRARFVSHSHSICYNFYGRELNLGRGGPVCNNPSPKCQATRRALTLSERNPTMTTRRSQMQSRPLIPLRLQTSTYTTIMMTAPALRRCRHLPKLIITDEVIRQDLLLPLRSHRRSPRGTRSLIDLQMGQLTRARLRSTSSLQKKWRFWCVFLPCRHHLCQLTSKHHARLRTP
jgi:hypothetical protein